jgi:cation-transporting ATPase I
LRSLIELTGPVALGAGIGLVASGLLRGRKLEDLVGSGVSLAVASVPEGLPLLATAAQLAAAERLGKRGALVRNVRSIEALGRVDVLCLDKTGTLTEGRIELVLASDGAVEQSVPELDAVTLPVLGAALRASADRGGRTFDPTEQALYRASDRLDVHADYACPGFHRAYEVSFEAGRGYHATVGQCEAGLVLDVKGAPEVVLSRCTGVRQGGQRVALDEAATGELARHAAALAARGLRVLAVAERIVPEGDSLDPRRLVGLTFLGLLAFSDPVRRRWMSRRSTGRSTGSACSRALRHRKRCASCARCSAWAAWWRWSVMVRTTPPPFVSRTSALRSASRARRPRGPPPTFCSPTRASRRWSTR